MNNKTKGSLAKVFFKKPHWKYWKIGKFETHEELIFFVGDAGFTHCVDDGDIVIPIPKGLTKVGGFYTTLSTTPNPLNLNQYLTLKYPPI